MLSKIGACSLVGIEASWVDVEVDIVPGLPAFEIVGLADKAVREAKERVRAALRNSGYQFPHQRITVNLAPADLKKQGTGFDLPIALGILLATEQIKRTPFRSCLAMGELSLEGEVRPISGILSMALLAKERGIFLLPAANHGEASLVQEAKLWPLQHLRDVEQEKQLPRTKKKKRVESDQLDMAEIKGQIQAKRALEVAAAGGHNLLFIGPPGAGKTMLAQRIVTILPSLSPTEAMEITRIYSVADLIQEKEALVQRRPYRSPHHSISVSALLGGSSHLKPGEITLAHHGVLFLDELTEFRRDCLEALRQPLEERQITLTRQNRTCTYPARFLLLAACNQCACLGTIQDGTCTCTPPQIKRYLSKISGPLWDRFDLHVEVLPLENRELLGQRKGEPSAAIRERVERATCRQRERFQGSLIFSNSQMTNGDLEKFCFLEPEIRAYLTHMLERISLSARAYAKILKVALTIADLAGAEKISTAHLAEALHYRSLDRREG